MIPDGERGYAPDPQSFVSNTQFVPCFRFIPPPLVNYNHGNLVVAGLTVKKAPELLENWSGYVMELNAHQIKAAEEYYYGTFGKEPTERWEPWVLQAMGKAPKPQPERPHVNVGTIGHVDFGSSCPWLS